MPLLKILKLFGFLEFSQDRRFDHGIVLSIPGDLASQMLVPGDIASLNQTINFEHVSNGAARQKISRSY